MITVAIVDDKIRNRTMMAERIASCEDLKLLFTAEHGVDFLAKARVSVPEAVLMDIEMPEMDGIQAVGVASALYPATRFIMLTVFDDEDKIFEAIRAGACGYLLKDDSMLSIAEAIRQAVELGGAPMSPGIARKALALLSRATLEKRDHTTGPYEISDREMEILRLLVAGHDYRAISERLFISPNTVRKHIGNVYQKLHINSKAQAIRLAMKKGWV